MSKEPKDELAVLALKLGQVRIEKQRLLQEEIRLDVEIRRCLSQEASR